MKYTILHTKNEFIQFAKIIPTYWQSGHLSFYEWTSIFASTTTTNMFNGPDFPKSLDEEVFNTWLENGRDSKMGYSYLFIIWDAYDAEYRPVYAEHRDEVGEYENFRTSTGRESLIAAYDLFSESRI